MISIILWSWLIGGVTMLIVSYIICPRAMPRNVILNLMVSLVLWPILLGDFITDLIDYLKKK